MHRTKVLTSFVLAAALLLLPATARADDASALLGRGIKAFNQGRFARAIKLLRRAIASAGENKLVAAKAELHVGLSHAIEKRQGAARAAFRRALVHDPKLRLDSSRYSADVVQAFRAVRGNMRGRLRVRASGGASLDVLIDGRAAGKTPLIRTLGIGQHEVRVGTGSTQIVKRVVVRADATQTLTVQAPAAGGDSADGSGSGSGSGSGAGGDSGDGDGSSGADSGSGRGHRWFWTYFALGGAVVAGIIAGVYWARAGNIKKDVEAGKDTEDNLRSTEDVAHAFGYGVAPALGAAALTLFILEGWVFGRGGTPREDRRTTFAPLIGPRRAGAALTIRF